MPGAVFIRGESFALRTIEEEDLDFLQRNWNHPAIRRRTRDDGPLNAEQVEERFEEEISGEEGTGTQLLVTREADDPAPVGYVALSWVDDAAGKAVFEFWLDPDEFEQSAATAALALLAEYAFDERRLHKLDTFALADEPDRAAALDAAGFQQEARLPDEAFVGGEHVDALRYGLLEDEWRQ